MHPFYSSDFATAVEKAIEDAELKTSCEFKVHLEDYCNEDVFDRAAYVFSELGLHKTVARNAVFIFIVVQNRKVVILADGGITSVIDNAQIQDEVLALTNAFREGNFIVGVEQSLNRMSAVLCKSFPRQANDVNEISNSISR
ncbi:MAG: TPM domain-containing protein [Bacteroidetes bacterium]|nr:TPM domain-containing protein [Bacteroidota bacterium]